MRLHSYVTCHVGGRGNFERFSSWNSSHTRHVTTALCLRHHNDDDYNEDEEEERGVEERRKAVERRTLEKPRREETWREALFPSFHHWKKKVAHFKFHCRLLTRRRKGRDVSFFLFLPPPTHPHAYVYSSSRHTYTHPRNELYIKIPFQDSVELCVIRFCTRGWSCLEIKRRREWRHPGHDGFIERGSNRWGERERVNSGFCGLSRSRGWIFSFVDKWRERYRSCI